MMGGLKTSEAMWQVQLDQDTVSDYLCALQCGIAI